MSRLPPAEKLPLAVRKNVRDEWESNKGDLEKRLSDLLGESWTIDINPLALYPYAKDGYAKESTGSMIASYVGDGISSLESYLSSFGDAGKTEINSIFSAHTLTMDVDVDKKFTYCGCTASPSGQLVILFGENYLGTNISDALQREYITKALNEASAAKPGMSYIARTGVKDEYEAKISGTQEKISELLQTPFVLEPSFEDVYAKLQAAGDKAPGNWEENLGNFVRMYMEALESSMRRQKFGEDEMMREALNESVDKAKVVFRVVDEGVMKALYNEVVIEDGVLYLQTTAERFGVNIDDVADKLVDLL